MTVPASPGAFCTPEAWTRYLAERLRYHFWRDGRLDAKTRTLEVGGLATYAIHDRLESHAIVRSWCVRRWVDAESDEGAQYIHITPEGREAVEALGGAGE